jgi:formamidopyrimidine-DNA glycosylase
LPEQAEVRIISEFFNEITSGKKVIKVYKNPLNKSKTDIGLLQKGSFRVFSEPRGKEIKLNFSHIEEKMILQLAKVGTIAQLKSKNEMSEEEFQKRAQLVFEMDDNSVVFIDDRTRFSIWRWGDWKSSRSPDIVLEHNNYRRYIYRNRNHKAFEKPIYEIMLHPRFFNGIGNFSRSEILARTRFSPFTPFKEILGSEILREDFFHVARETLEEIYQLGGCQFTHWKNPNNVDPRPFKSWIKAYNRYDLAYFTRDSAGKIFWFRKEWLKEFYFFMKKLGKEESWVIDYVHKKLTSRS